MPGKIKVKFEKDLERVEVVIIVFKINKKLNGVGQIVLFNKPVCFH